MHETTLKKIVLRTDYSRHFSDPLNKASEEDPYNIHHHLLVCQAVTLPSAIPTDPNPRAQNIDYKIYRQIQESLERE
ncbi:MAG: hypothetical protein ABIE75_01300 [Candidatus Omnitrophota bacterium]